MRKFYILFLLLTACSFDNTKNYLNDNLNKEILDFNKEYSIKEYGAILEKYNARTGYPKIN
tara:strand:+ start:161 stop:343 length:183 start_codon:yes stop_codon:yes gene_type:complete